MTRDEHAVLAQRALWPLAAALQGVEDALDSILEEMPDAPDDMLSAHATADFLLEIEGGIYFLLNDDLRALVAGLKRLATVTYADFARNCEVTRLRQVN